MARIPLINDIIEKERIIYYLQHRKHREVLSKDLRNSIQKKSRKFELMRNELFVKENGIYKKFVCSFDEQNKSEILRIHHTEDHIGGKNLYQRIKEKFIGISRQECLLFVQNCNNCQGDRPLNLPNTHLTPIIPIFPRQRLIIDTVDMRRYREYNSQFSYIFTFIDSFTKFGWAYKSIDKSGESFSKILKLHLQHEGKWHLIHTDNGREFCNLHVDELLNKYSIRIVHGRPYHPQSQGQVERFNRTIKERLRRTTGANQRWIDHIDNILENYNNTSHRATGTKPFILFKCYDPSSDLFVRNFSNDLDFETIQLRIFRYIQKWKDEYNNRAILQRFSNGDTVMIAKNYNLRYFNRVGALESLYESNNYIVIEVFAFDSLVRRISDNFEKKVHNSMIKKVN